MALLSATVLNKIEFQTEKGYSQGWQTSSDACIHDHFYTFESTRHCIKDSTIIDPCMGSGHILVYAFEVLMHIYESAGYAQKDAAAIIIENNLFGLDIDDRAYQLSYFAIMMKGRKYDRRFLTKGIKPNLCAIQESNGLNSFEHGAGQLQITDMHKQTANYLINAFRDAKEYGSIVNIEENDYEGLFSYLEQLHKTGAEDMFLYMWLNNISDIIPALIKQGKIMARKYDVVITNPPYFSGSDMSPKLSEFVKKNFPDSKTDMFAVFIEKCLQMAKASGYTAMITMHSWMFLSSYEKLRKSLITKDIINMAHLGARAFEEIGGEVVQTTAFVYRKDNVNKYRATFVRLVDYKSENAKKEAYLESLGGNKDRHIAIKDNFEKIPGSPIAYWVSPKFLECYNHSLINSVAFSDGQILTGNNDKYLKNIWEVDNTQISRGANWVLHAKGGEYRRWYGNIDTVLSWSEKSRKHYRSDNISRFPKEEILFRRGITWSLVSTNPSFGVRELGADLTFNKAAATILFNNENYTNYVIGFMNTKVAQSFLRAINPTINNNIKDVLNMPFIFNKNAVEAIDLLVDKNINISRVDWDSFEVSYNFKCNPLLCNHSNCCYISDAFINWNMLTDKRFLQLKANEEKLNDIFIEIYGLQEELTPEVADKDVTIRKADLTRDIKSFISYAVGCMFGRYSLDTDGLAYAGGTWDASKYSTFTPDSDNILPITDEEYFTDDIVTRFVEFVKTVYGSETLEENLDFIATALITKGNTSREVLRNYFLKDFYKDHCKVYQKRPIYWMFDSGKENGFKALIYLHRYDEDTVGRVRADYLHKTQAAIENAMSHCDVVLESSSPASDKAKAVKQKEKLVKQLAETRIYDQAIAHIAHKRISLDLDDGVVVNYAKFQDVLVSSEGKKAVKVDLLGKI